MFTPNYVGRRVCVYDFIEGSACVCIVGNWVAQSLTCTGVKATLDGRDCLNVMGGGGVRLCCTSILCFLVEMKNKCHFRRHTTPVIIGASFLCCGRLIVCSTVMVVVTSFTRLLVRRTTLHNGSVFFQQGYTPGENEHRACTYLLSKSFLEDGEAAA